MKQYALLLFIFLALAGCKSKEKDAQALVDQARSLWDQVMPSPPEVRGGNITLDKEGVLTCVSKLGEAKNILDRLAANYGETEVWGSEKTKTLNVRARSQINICNQVKYVQGW